jgi:hypothetical protein
MEESGTQEAMKENQKHSWIPGFQINHSVYTDKRTAVLAAAER